MRFAFFILLVFCTFSSLTSADDWPQWLGPDRASEWREKGIVEAFPDEGLKVKWRTPVGLGYSGPAVAGVAAPMLGASAHRGAPPQRYVVDAGSLIASRPPKLDDWVARCF